MWAGGGGEVLSGLGVRGKTVRMDGYLMDMIVSLGPVICEEIFDRNRSKAEIREQVLRC